MSLDRKTALSDARELRTCPPPEFRDDPIHRDRYLRHRSGSPRCARPDAPTTLLRFLARLPAEAAVDLGNPLPSPGHLRFVRAERGGWRGDLHMNPPLVLVLEAAGDRVRASQTYPDVLLAGPGDLILPPALTGLPELFAESWNRYDLRPRDLGPAVGQVSPAIARAAAELDVHPDELPGWALRPRPLTAGDPRHEFRRLEREVAAVFGRPIRTRGRGETGGVDYAVSEVASIGIRECAGGYGGGARKTISGRELRAMLRPRWGEATAWIAVRSPNGAIALEPVPEPVPWRPFGSIWRVEGCPGPRPAPIAGAFLLDPSGAVEWAREMAWDPGPGCFRAGFAVPPGGRRLVLISG